MALMRLQRKVQNIQQELVSVEAGLHLNPSAAQFRRLERKIAELEVMSLTSQGIPSAAPICPLICTSTGRQRFCYHCLIRTTVGLQENEIVKEKRWQSILEESQQVNVIQAAMERKKWYAPRVVACRFRKAARFGS